MKVPMVYNLYVNCWSDERADADTLEPLFNNFMEKARIMLDNWKSEKSASYLNDFTNTAMTMIDSISGTHAFIYSTGDKEVASRLLPRPYAFFRSLRDILQDYLKKANHQCNRARQYIETPDLSVEDMYDIFAEADHDEDLRETLEKHLNVLKIEDPAIGKDLYVAKDLTVRINRKKLFNSAYTAYQNQFYYYPERLVDELSRRLNIPVYISYYTPVQHKLETVENDRDSILQTLNSLYRNPVTKSILCDVLHNGKKIPADIDIEYRKMLAKIQQSKLYKKEYLPLQKASPSVTFDYIVKALNTLNGQSQVNKHITRIICMQNNQDILQKGSTSVKATKKVKQFNEQKVLISIIAEKRKADGKKYYTISESFLDSTLKVFNKEISALDKGYEPKTTTQLLHLLRLVFITKNRDIASRSEELGEPILCIEDVPFK